MTERLAYAVAMVGFVVALACIKVLLDDHRKNARGGTPKVHAQAPSPGPALRNVRLVSKDAA